MKSDYELFRKGGSEPLWRKLHKEYPKMPHADKCKVHRIISSTHSDPAGKTARESLRGAIYSYYRDSYTPFKFLSRKRSLNKEAISELHEKIEKTIESWRGGIDPRSSFEKTEAELPTTETSNDQTFRKRSYTPPDNHTRERNYTVLSGRGSAGKTHPQINFLDETGRKCKKSLFIQEQK